MYTYHKTIHAQRKSHQKDIEGKISVAYIRAGIVPATKNKNAKLDRAI
jgi:hypothetical protein